MIGMHALGELQKNHKISYEDLEKSIAEYEGAAIKFSMDAISDAKQRENYNKNVGRIVAEVRSELERGKINVREAAHYCVTLRNRVMAETRALTSAQGRVVAEFVKKDPKTLDVLREKYAQKIFKQSFDGLSWKQQNRVFYEIILSAGRPNNKFNVINKTLVVMARVFIVYTVGHAIQSVYEAENKFKEAAKQGGAIAFGFAGASFGAQFGAAGGPLLAFALAIVGGLAGGFLGGVIGEAVSDYLWSDEVKEIDNYAVDNA
ncbi:hypothetical protein [Pseudomonas sp. zfem002]|uniref:hypothetical protein n=1 Tax=Pseudomonas sp. zfem002 TaxID=3078197 RepID=UPI002927EFFD|nr:hypothetical protein [Pseudomonas sp. zfem002]MDU9393622.1 hypothetical protein [Pseudomonas sp. zfem002]